METLIILIICAAIYLCHYIVSGDEWKKWLKVGGAGLFTFMLIMNVWHIVPAGHTGVGIIFGEVIEKKYMEGFNLVNPFADFKDFSIRRQALNFQSATKKEEDSSDVQDHPIIAASSDELRMDADITIPFRLNAQYAWWVYKYIGTDYVKQFIKPAGRTASRDGIASFTSSETMVSKRGDLALEIEKVFYDNIVNDLVEQGMSQPEAKKAFTAFPVMLRKVLPPDKVMNAIAEKKASEQELIRQGTMTKIADEIANRREKEGKGINKLFSQLPKNLKATDIAQILNAMANKTRADAMKKAVEEGQAKIMIMGGGSSVAVPAPQ